MMEMVRACPLCGAREAQVLLETGKHSPAGEPYRVVTCRECHLRYTRPLPTVRELTELYGQTYYGNDKPGLLSWHSARLLLHRSVLWGRRQALLGRPPGRVLDVGCGDGDFLASLKRRGWEVFGTDFSSPACELARSKGITAHQGELAGANFPANYFDVVTLWHSLEHVPDPVAELAEVRRVLRNDGLLVIEVPDSGCLTFRLCGERWFPLGAPGHLQHFTATTLQRLLDRSGFTPLRQQNFHHLDFTLSLMSFMDRLSVLGHLKGNHYFVSDYKRANLASKALFLALGLLIGLLSLPYSMVAALLSGNSETVTITARKSAL